MRARAVLVAFALLTGGCSTASPDPATELEVQTFADLGPGIELAESAVRQIITGEIEPPAYNSDPPTSGPHASAHAACGIFRQPVPDVYLVHNLEIGVVALQYSAALEEVEIERLEEFARGLDGHVIVAPRAGLGSPLVASAWTVLMELDGLDETSLQAFYDRYARRGPTAGECPLAVDEGA